VCDSCGRSFRESGTLARHIKSRIPCTRKSEGDLPRYGTPEVSKKKKKWKSSNVEQKTLQILITKDQVFPPRSLLGEENPSEMQIVTDGNSSTALQFEVLLNFL